MRLVVLSVVVVACARMGVARGDVGAPALPAATAAPGTAPETSAEARAAVPAAQEARTVAPIGSLAAHRLTGAIQVDGRLDEAAWRAAAPAGSFRQEAPHHGQHATSPTEVRVLYDDQYLYVGARMHHAAGSGRVTALVHRRDRDSASDWFGVAVD